MKIKVKNYNYEPIGKRIKSVRLERKYTQEYVAEKLDVSCQHISDIERGLNGMSVPALMEFCKVLEIDADYLLFGTATRNEKNPKNKRQVIIVTHNPNIAIACDAEQIIYCNMDKTTHQITYTSGAIENENIRKSVVDVLEGTLPAFALRRDKYFISDGRLM